MDSQVFLFLGNLFSSDMLIIMFVALLLFGGEKLPEIARGIGRGIRDFKDASDDIKREINEQINNFDVKDDYKHDYNQTRQNQQPANNHLLESYKPVENTIPVNDGHQAENQNTASDNNEKSTLVYGHKMGNHPRVPHIDPETGD